MNKEFLKMQKLAGLITESQFKKKINEDKSKSVDFGNLKNIEYYGPGRKDGEYIVRLVAKNKEEENNIINHLDNNSINYEKVQNKENKELNLIDISSDDFFKKIKP